MNNYCKASLLLVAVSISWSSMAQKKPFTMAEATGGLSGALATKGLKNASWQPGTENLWQVEKKNNTEAYTVTDFAHDGAQSSVFAIVQNGKSGSTLVTPALKWLNKDEAWYMNGSDIMLARLNKDRTKFATSTLFTLPQGAEHVTIDKSKKVAYTIENNLWLWSAEKGAVAVTEEKNKGIVAGQSVHRDEFGIDRGIFFSPKGNYLAYYRMDQSMVKDYPVIDWSATPATVELVKYPMAGGVSHEVTLCVFDPATGKTVTMATDDGEKDHYLTSVTWSPDEKNIYIALLNRGQNHLALNRYNAASGEKIKTLFEESSAKYVHPTHSLTFLPWQDNEFIWWSERDGFDHLYLYKNDGSFVRQVTHGRWLVNEIAGITPEGHRIVITTSKESPLEKHIYSVSTDNDFMERIDAEPGMHTALCSEDGRLVLDVFNGAGNPKTTCIRSATSSHPYAKVLLKSDNPLAAYNRPQIKDVTLKAADGVTTLFGKLILPVNFNPERKYPVVVYLYNGPNVQLIHNSFPESGNLWYEYMAQHGYIVFTMDGRGSDNRGVDFEQATFRKLGDVEMQDQLKGVDYLKSLPFVDASRMGVHGWSYGGFMTTSLMLKYPGVFKCAVAGGPVMDWKMYEVMYTERYMDKPSENPDGYENANLLTKVSNLKGKLLLIHGTQDATVVWQHSIDFLKKAVDEGVQVDYFVYPGYEHNVRGKDRAHLMQKVTDYFDQYLKPGM
jgi:dipeptidyl-peptidase-4